MPGSENNDEEVEESNKRKNIRVLNRKVKNCCHCVALCSRANTANYVRERQNGTIRMVATDRKREKAKQKLVNGTKRDWIGVKLTFKQIISMDGTP